MERLDVGREVLLHFTALDVVLHHLHQRLRRSIVEIGGGQGDVTQRRRLEGPLQDLDGLVGETPGITLAPVHRGQADVVKAVVGEIGSTVADLAVPLVGIDEHLEAAHLLLGHRTLVPLDPAVEGRIVADDGALVAGDRLGDGLLVDLLTRIGLGESRPVPLVGTQETEHLIEIGVHLHAGLHRPDGLILQVLLAAIPHLDGVVGGVDHRGRSPPQQRAPESTPGGETIGPAQHRVVTAGAGDVTVPAQPGIEEQLLAQGDPLRGRFVVLGIGWLVRQQPVLETGMARLEHQPLLLFALGRRSASPQGNHGGQ